MKDFSQGDQPAGNITVIKAGRLREAGHILRMGCMGHANTLTFNTYEWQIELGR
jgi:hypothetical protein